MNPQLRRFAPWFALLVAGCGADPSTSAADGPASDGKAAVQPAVAPASPPAGPGRTDSGAAPAPTDLRTFGDWTVGCDNIATCQAASLLPEEEPIGEGVTMAVERLAGPAGAIRLRFHSQGELAAPLTLAVDDGPALRGGERQEEGVVELRGADARRLASAMANGGTLRVNGDRVSLAGLSAALRWMDERQGRAGTVGALVARGAAPAARAAPLAPVVRAIRPDGTAAAITPAMLARMQAQAECEAVPGRDLGEAEAHALGGGATLVLLPCSTGAYNLSSSVFVVRDGAVAAAMFDHPTGMSPDPLSVPSVTNGAFEDGILSEFAKGRGLGDCGVQSRSAWDGRRFRLVELTEMGECRGNSDYIRTWTARVVR